MEENMKRALLLSSLLLLTAGTAWADEQNATDSCDIQCDSGQVRKGFSDGDHRATCYCTDPGEGMVDTVADPEDNTSPSAEDGEPMPANAPDQVVVDTSEG